MGKKKPFLSGILLGGAVGAVAALLLAPKSGKELRQDLRKWYQQMEKDVDKAMKKVKTVSQSTYQKTVDGVLKTYEKVKELSPEDMDQLRTKLLDKWNSKEKTKATKTRRKKK